MAKASASKEAKFLKLRIYDLAKRAVKANSNVNIKDVYVRA
jgi:hypothetical protein